MVAKLGRRLHLNPIETEKGVGRPRFPIQPLILNEFFPKIKILDRYIIGKFMRPTSSPSP